MLKIFYKFIVFLVLLLMQLTACTSSLPNVGNEREETNPDKSAPLDGIWVGEFDIRGRGPYDFTAVHLQDKAFAFSLKAKAMCVGTISFDGEHVLKKYVLFALDGGPFDWANLTGTLEIDEEKTKSIATYFKTLNGGDTGALKVTYSKLYDEPSSLVYLQGDWSYTDRDNLTSNVSINNEGMLIGSDSDGCKYTGNLSIINSSYNVYHARIEVTECASVNDVYEGVAFLEESTLAVQIANKKYALFFAFENKK